MIEKITTKDPDFDDLKYTVNQLVDAVNELQKHEEQHLDLLTQLNEMRLQNTKKSRTSRPIRRTTQVDWKNLRILG